MNFLFISYWGINEGLTVATVDPHLEVLSRFKHVKKIILTTIERDNKPLRKLTIEKVKHIPLSSGISFIDKFRDYSAVPKILVKICKEQSIDTIICRGAPAGALGYLVWKKTKIHFYVESFEPHAEYMRESGVWSLFDPRYWLSHYWEEQQKKYAKGLLPVANNYRKKLISEGVPEVRIKVLPCTVDTEKFKFNPEERKKVRAQLNISEQAILGIYVGKYGGMYMDEEAFELYRQAFNYWSEFFLIILSPREHHLHVKSRIQEHSLPRDKIYIQQADHKAIPAYLSAADFAFATYKPGKSKAHLSPIKVGEYWANGLPLVLTEGVGDDSEIIAQGNSGELVKNSTVNFLSIEKLIKEEDMRSNIKKLAMKFRSRSLVEDAYIYFYDERMDN
jgi:glycosyltransferase involved in cell wall biosynthesis